MKSLACMALVCPILEYGAVCWDSFREGQINALDQAQKAEKFANLTDDLNWEMAQSRKTALICTLYKQYPRELALKAIGDRLKQPY